MLEIVHKADTWKRKTARLVLIAIGFSVFEWVAGMPVALVVAVSSFGVRDARTAWLYRKLDPNRGRGRAISWFYLAYACWRVLVALFAYVLVVGVFQGLSAANQKDRDSTIVEPVVGGMIVCGCSAIGIPAAWVGVVLAIRRDVRVWLDPSFRLSSGWPPGSSRCWPPNFRGSSNLAKYFPLLIWSTAGFVFVVDLGFLIATLLTWRERGTLTLLEWLVAAFYLSPSIVLSRFALSPYYRSRLDQIAATTPRESFQ